MILKRLYELAERENLLDDPAFESLPVPIVIKIGDGGQYFGLEVRDGLGRVQVPKPIVASSNAGAARHFFDTLERVLPVSDEEKSVTKRRTFWRQMDEAAAASGDPALLAVCVFGRKLKADTSLADRIRGDLAAIKSKNSDRCTFAWASDAGLTILDRPTVKSWWREFYESSAKLLQGKAVIGVCQVTGKVGPIASVHATKISGLSGGKSTGVSLISNHKPAFESYGLNGSESASIGFKAAEGYTRALQSLLQEKLHRSKITVAGDVFLFWSREAGEVGDILACLDGTDPQMAAKLFDSLHRGGESEVVADDAFFCLTLSGNSARAVVRDYLEAPISEVKHNLRRWFGDLAIISRHGNEIIRTFPLWQLALATAVKSKAVAPAVPPQLLAAALKGQKIGAGILAACLQRLKAEGTRGFTAFRIGLIKLTLLRKGITMDEHVMETGSAAYVCGRLMAVFERAQWGALGDVNANVVDRFYGTASTAPGLVFPRLFKSAQQHLSKLESERPGMATNIKKDIESLCGQLQQVPHLLRLEEQGEFALGFYHQRAEYRRQGLENKERRAEQKAAAQV